MKREEILNMPAGREMDALVLMELFGVMAFRDSNGQPYKIGAFQENEPVPNYSTDVSDSLIVLSEISAEWDSVMVNNQNFRDYPNMHFGCRMQALDKSKHIKTVFALGETQALANCRAALLTTLKD